MKTQASWWMMVALLVLAACGPATGLPQGGPGEPRVTSPLPQVSSPTESSAPASGEGSEGVVLVYERSGGIAGIVQVFTVYADGRVILTSNRETAGKPAQVDPETVKALVLAMERAGFFDLQESYLTEDVCCDRVVHRIVVYRDGQAKSVTTIDGYEGMPEALRQVLDALNRFLQETVANSQ